MIEAKHYSDNFFLGHESGAYASAKIILPLVNEVFHPRSVVDIGCGVGNWLKVWKDELGVTDITGVEGPYISKDVLQIPKERIILQDLKQPLQLQRKFDLAMSLEVAEHLPESSADHFVNTLTGLSDIILFSASIPGQDGTYHINEQVPEYWAKKFIAKGFVPVDFIRDKVWNNQAVEWWYQQNTLLFIKKNVIDNYPAIKEAGERTNPDYLLRIHPWIYFYNYSNFKRMKPIGGYIHWKLYQLKKWFQGKK